MIGWEFVFNIFSNLGIYSSAHGLLHCCAHKARQIVTSALFYNIFLVIRGLFAGGLGTAEIWPAVLFPIARHAWQMELSLLRSARLGLEVLERASRRSVDWSSANPCPSTTPKDDNARSEEVDLCVTINYINSILHLLWPSMALVMQTPYYVYLNRRKVIIEVSISWWKHRSKWLGCVNASVTALYLICHVLSPAEQVSFSLLRE